MSRSGRSPNFIEEEVEQLVQLVHQQKDIFGIKKQDFDSNKLKDAAWEAVADSFNAHKPPNKIRTAKVLKIKFENEKKRMRNKITKMREQSELDLKIQKLSDYEELLLSIMTADSNDDDVFGAEALDNDESMHVERSESELSFFKDSCENGGSGHKVPTETESIFFEASDDEDCTKKAKKRNHQYEVGIERWSGSNDAKKNVAQLEREKLVVELNTVNEQLEAAKLNYAAAKEKREADKFKRKLEIETIKNELEVSKLKLDLVKMELEIRKKEFNKDGIK